MAGVSLVDLLEHVGVSADDLKTKCSDGDLNSLSLVIPSWETVAPFLNLKETDIEDIRSDSTKARVKTLNMLKKWKKRHGFRATFKFLVDVFLIQLEDAEMAEEVCKQLKKHKAIPQSEDAIDSASNAETTPQSEAVTDSATDGSKEFNRKNVDKLLVDVMLWEELGEKLGLPKGRLKEISHDYCYRGINRQKSVMLDLWFRYDTEASWEKLGAALEEIDERVLAEKIRTEYMIF